MPWRLVIAKNGVYLVLTNKMDVMKKCLLIALLSMIIMSACKSEEEVVKEKFLDYVQLELDDPSVITEIVLVEKFGTRTLQDGKKFLKFYREEFDSTNVRLTNISAWLSEYEGEYNSTIKNIAQDFHEALIEYEGCEHQVSILDSIYLKIGDEDVIENIYRIKYREKEGDSTVLKYYFASQIENKYNFYSSNPGDYVLLFFKYDMINAYATSRIISSIRSMRYDSRQAEEDIKKLESEKTKSNQE